jgi:hypothetical protein
MRTHDGRINHLQCRVGQAAAGERLQHHIPDATVSPAAELPKNRIPVAELLRQIAPRRAGPHQPKRRVHHTAMVARRTASATDQKRFEIRPLIIGQQSANQGCPPQRAALNQFSIPASIDLSTRPSTTLADSLTPLLVANPFSAMRTSLRWSLSDEFEDGVAHGWQSRLGRWSVDSFFPALLLKGGDAGGRHMRSSS